MQYKQLGGTGLMVSEICLGTMTFGGKGEVWTKVGDLNQTAADAILGRAVDAGVNFIDTADVYSEGLSEEITGRAIADSGRPRSDFVIATKLNSAMGPGPNDRGSSRGHIMDAVKASLRRLGTDYIDLYQLHRPMGDIAIDESLRALDDLVRAGKIRYMGTSFFTSWKIVESLWASKELGLNRMVCEQPPYSILERRIERELIPMAQTYGIALIPFSPLAGGMLSGKYRAAKADEGRLADANNWRNRMRISDPIVDAAQRVVAIADAKGVSPAAFATAWVMHQPASTSPIMGPRTMEQLEGYLAALDVTITEEDRAAVDAIVPPGEYVSPYYQDDFGDFGPSTYRW